MKNKKPEEEILPLKNKKWEERTSFLQGRKWIDESQSHCNRLLSMGFKDLPEECIHPRMDEEDKSEYRQWPKKQKELRLKHYEEKGLFDSQEEKLPLLTSQEEKSLSDMHYDYMRKHPEVLKIIDKYTNFQYKHFNELVKKYLHSKFSVKTNVKTLDTFEMYDMLLLNAAILHAPRLPTSLTVYRGLHFYDSEKTEEGGFNYGFEEDKETISPGKMLNPIDFPQAFLNVDKVMAADRFLSTTLSPSYAAAINKEGLTKGVEFLDALNEEDEEDRERRVFNLTQRCCFYEIVLPAEYPFLYVNNQERNLAEYEALLPFMHKDASQSHFDVIKKRTVLHRIVQDELKNNPKPTEVYVELAVVTLQPQFYFDNNIDDFKWNSFKYMCLLCNFSELQIDSMQSKKITTLLQLVNVLYRIHCYMTRQNIDSRFHEFLRTSEHAEEKWLQSYKFLHPSPDDVFMQNFASKMKLVEFWLHYHCYFTIAACELTSQMKKDIGNGLFLEEDFVDLICLWNVNNVPHDESLFKKVYVLFSRGYKNGGTEIWIKKMYHQTAVIAKPNLDVISAGMIVFANVKILVTEDATTLEDNAISTQDIVVGNGFTNAIMNQENYTLVPNNYSHSSSVWINDASKNIVSVPQAETFVSKELKSKVAVHAFQILDFDFKRIVLQSLCE